MAVVVGSLSWLVALVVLAFVVGHRDAVELALLVLAGSFAIGVLASIGMRHARVREEREP